MHYCTKRIIIIYILEQIIIFLLTFSTYSHNINCKEVINMIGSNIRSYRIAKKLSQQELGQLVNLNQSLISRIERNDRKVYTDELQKFCNALNVSIEDLLKNDDPALVS